MVVVAPASGAEPGGVPPGDSSRGGSVVVVVGMVGVAAPSGAWTTPCSAFQRPKRGSTVTTNDLLVLSISSLTNCWPKVWRVAAWADALTSS